MEETRKVFYLKLQGFAQKIGEDFTDEGDEGEPGRTVKYCGHLVGNYPWIYLDYEISGLFYIETFQQIDKLFRALCEAEQGAYYQSVTFTNGHMRLKLIFREDHAYEAKKKGPPGSPEGPQDSGSTTL